MIEDKGLGLKVAENSEESKWAEIKERAEKEIFNSGIEIEINRKIIELCNEKLKTFKE